MTNEYRHIPVLLAECLEHLNLQPQHTFVDATLGGAGHSLEVAKQLGPQGTLIGIDQDDAAHAAASKRLNELPDEQRPHIELLRGNFGDMDELLLSAKYPASMRSCSTWAFPRRSSTRRLVASPSRRTAPLICGWIRVNKP